VWLCIEKCVEMLGEEAIQCLSNCCLGPVYSLGNWTTFQGIFFDLRGESVTLDIIA